MLPPRYNFAISAPGVCLLLLAGCGGGSDSVTMQTPDSGIDGDELFVEVTVPDFLNSANINNLNARFSYGASTFDLIDSGTRFSAQVNTGVRDPSVTWTLEFYEVYQGQALVLLQSDAAALSPTAATLTIDSELFSRPDVDLDGDGNLDERNADAEPFDSFSTIANPSGQNGVAVSTLTLEGDFTGLSSNVNEDLRVTATVDDQVVSLRSRGGASFAGAINFTSAGDLRLLSMEVLSGNRQLIARWEGQITTQPGPNLISLQAEDLTTDIDSDGDGLRNLQEFEISNTTSTGVDVVDIDQIDTESAPVIDGRLEDAIWRQRMITSPEQGAGGLWIDKLLKTTPANTYGSGEPAHEWAAVHDGETLYLAIRVIDESIVRDSGAQQWQDDSVELYIDGDHSRLDAYDGVNDYQLIFIAPAGDEVEDSAAAGALVVGQNSAPLPATISYAISVAGFASDIDAGWSAGEQNVPPVSSGFNVEVAIALDELGIGADGLMGIDVHINDDDNGGIRDSKWNWAWSRQLDLHWQDPSHFGAARLR